MPDNGILKIFSIFLNVDRTVSLLNVSIKFVLKCVTSILKFSRQLKKFSVCLFEVNNFSVILGRLPGFNQY